MHLNKTKRIFGLDLIRAIAILAVLLCHLSYPLYPFFKGEAERVFNFAVWIGGYYGVELFFILSGFLIGGIFMKTVVKEFEYHKFDFSFIWNFWIRRWFRTLPNYYLFLIVNVLLAFLFVSKISLEDVLSFLFFFQRLNPFESISFYGVSWSLAVEEWFYFLLPLCYVLSKRVFAHKKYVFPFAITLLYLISIFSKIMYALSQPIVSNHKEAFHFSTFFRLDSIVFGVLLAYLWNKKPLNLKLKKYRKWSLFLGLVLLFLSFIIAYLFLARNEQSSLTYFCFSPLCSISIVLSFPYLIHLRVRANTLFYNVIVFFSLTSYSLYLCHIPIMQLMQHFVFDNPFFLSPIGALVSFMILIILPCLIALFLYKYFELPFLHLRDRFVIGPKNKSS